MIRQIWWKIQIEWMPWEWEQSLKRKITRSDCADQYPKGQLKSIGLAQIRLGRLSDTPEAGQLPDQISTSERVLLCYTKTTTTMIRQGKLIFPLLFLLCLSIVLFVWEKGPAILNRQECWRVSRLRYCRSFLRDMLSKWLKWQLATGKTAKDFSDFAP